MIGQRLSPILAEIEQALWEHEDSVKTPPEFTDEGFRAACKIFMAAMLDRSFVMMKSEGISLNSSTEMANKMGRDMRQIIRVYTGIDSHELYNTITP